MVMRMNVTTRYLTVKEDGTVSGWVDERDGLIVDAAPCWSSWIHCRSATFKPSKGESVRAETVAERATRGAIICTEYTPSLEGKPGFCGVCHVARAHHPRPGDYS